MSDDVMKAAERLRTIDSSNLFYWRSDAPNRDCADVARWSLPLLEAEPITEEWLESLGVKRAGNVHGVLMFRLHADEGVVDATLFHSPRLWRVEISRMKVGRVQLQAETITRGSVLCAAAALGITLIERKDAT
jgi:hypothetical protein